jgi:hypothetical protein
MTSEQILISHRHPEVYFQLLFSLFCIYSTAKIDIFCIVFSPDIFLIVSLKVSHRAAQYYQNLLTWSMRIFFFGVNSLCHYAIAALLQWSGTQRVNKSIEFRRGSSDQARSDHTSLSMQLLRISADVIL